MRKRTWKILRWDNRPEKTTEIELACPNCSRDAYVPMGEPGALIIAAIGLNLVFDPSGHKPPDNFMPTEMQCRGCGTVWGDDHVR